MACHALEFTYWGWEKTEKEEWEFGVEELMMMMIKFVWHFNSLGIPIKLDVEYLFDGVEFKFGMTLIMCEEAAT